MRILIEDLPGTNRWEVSMLPSTPEDIARGQPTPAEIATVLVGVAYDLLRQAPPQAEEPKPQLELPPERRLELPPGLEG